MAFNITRVCVSQLQHMLALLDILALFVSALTHDFDHRGTTNSFQINACTELAVLYSDVSPLEHHHSGAAFGQVLSRDECNVFKNLRPAERRAFRKLVCKAILATDMNLHESYLQRLRGHANHRFLKTEMEVIQHVSFSTPLFRSTVITTRCASSYSVPLTGATKAFSR